MDLFGEKQSRFIFNFLDFQWLVYFPRVKTEGDANFCLRLGSLQKCKHLQILKQDESYPLT